MRAVVGDNEKFQSTRDKIDSFKAGAGTILFFEDQSVIRGMQENVPLYAKQFPIWAHQTNAMHQYVIWTALASMDIGASLQHYNPIIDQQVAETWSINEDWELNAQMVFGAIKQPAGDKEFQSVESRMQVFGS